MSANRPRTAAFTLIELLVVMAILSVLLVILSSALSAVRSSAKRLVCSANLRTVIGEFSAFADNNHPLGRGDSESLGAGRFRINDFQDMLYRLDEYWDQGKTPTAELSSEREPMMCPAGAARLTRRHGLPCGPEALGPVGDVSIAMNMRLYRPVVSFRGKNVLAPTASAYLSSRILNHPYVPLVLDADAEQLSNRGIDPFYMAPPVDGLNDPYSKGRFWAQSRRHGRVVNVGFVGGHVLSSSDPAEERWNWSFQAESR